MPDIVEQVKEISREALLEIVEGFKAGETTFSEVEMDAVVTALRTTKACGEFKWRRTPDTRASQFLFLGYEFTETEKGSGQFMCTRDPETELPTQAGGIGFRSLTKWSQPGFYKRYDSASQEASGTRKVYK